YKKRTRSAASGRNIPLKDHIAKLTGGVLCLASKLVAELGSQFVLFFGNGASKLLAESRLDVVLCSQGFAQAVEPFDQLVVFILFLRLVMAEQFSEPLQALVELLDRGLGTFFFQRRERGSLSAMEKNEGSILFVRNGPFFVRRMLADKIHES